MTDKFSTAILIRATAARVWSVLTNPELMTQWLGEPEMEIKVDTDWKVNSPILIRGFHHVKFENKGIVLQFDKVRRLSYTHLSSVSRLPDKKENFSILEFTLSPTNESTLLTLDIQNFPTESIRKHLVFYWRTTVGLIKNVAETEQQL